MTAGTVPLRSALAGGVLTLTLDRPEKRNALNAAMVEALHAALERADLDAEARVVVLRGAGKDFCAGADLDELLASADLTLAENEAAALRLGALFGRMRALPKPVLAVASARASAPASRSSSASGTTRETRPVARASSAPSRRPVRTRSSAAFSPAARRSSVMTIAGTKPRWISG